MSLEVVEFPGGRKGEFQCDIGTVVGSQVWSETSVSSSGGGGYVGREGGQVHAPQVYSTVRDRTRYWLRYPNGKETAIVDGIAARDGHRVARIYGFLGGDRGELLAQINLTTDGQVYRPAAGSFWRAYRRRTATRFAYLIYLVWFALLYVIGPSDRPGEYESANRYFLLLLFGFPIALWIVRVVRNARYQFEIRQAVQSTVYRIREEAQASRLAKPTTAA